MTFWGQGPNLALMGHKPWSYRIGNALLSYLVYLRQFIWPVELAAVYPRNLVLPLWPVLGALLVLLGVTAAVLVWRRRCPYLLVGWLWYLGMLVPVVGLVQFGTQGMADRHTYLTQIGLCMALAWGAADVGRRWPYRRGMGSIAAALVLAALMVGSWRQTLFWCDTETMWTHALACGSQNSEAWYGLGTTRAAQHRTDEAMEDYRKALQIDPNFPEALNSLGALVIDRGQFDQAMTHFRQALHIQPNYADAHHNLALCLAALGRPDEALAHYEKAVELDPGWRISASPWAEHWRPAASLMPQ